ncbi:molybdenum cofactor sulfurase 1 isoform X2 [Orussus abietinus]|uniref:molybdenum cofactor sulfurase 1 isoform X2 n=1 Tax=Orussus abietinus TaxID=222816 RepID=UPI00062581E5|nr:molybdenum cofactor sulfurase 1 isoform X2 [Orussus abietinus]
MEEGFLPSYQPVYDKEIIEGLDQEFSRLKDECYVDHAGATLYAESQIKRVQEELLSSIYANPHSIGTAGNGTQDNIDRIRFRILEHFHTSSDEYSVVFTSGATASLKTVAEMFDFENSELSSSTELGCFVYVQDNHTSVLGMRETIAQRGARVICLSHDDAFKTLTCDSADTDDGLWQCGDSLFVYSAQCNFSGLKYPLNWIEKVHNKRLSSVTGNQASKWYVLLDAATFAATNDLDLSVYKPDFVCISFYKMFGYPTGIGALLVKNSSANVLKKTYYGGGTVKVSLSSDMFHVKRDILHERLEDGTLPFLSIISLRHGFDVLSKFSQQKISEHVFSLARHLHHSLLMMHHRNGKPVVKLLSDTDYEDKNLQGGIVAFNLLRSNGECIGYMEVLNMAALYKVHLRTGCFCNPGACQRHLHLTNQEIMENYDAGYTCGGDRDLINGKPTGAIRISLGYMSTIDDVQRVLLMIRKCFLDGPEITKTPRWWFDYRIRIKKKYIDHSTGLKNEKVKSADRYIHVAEKSNENSPSFLRLTQGNDYEFEENDRNPAGKPVVLKRVFIYPIKSCGAYEIKNSWKLGPRGLQYDREWMIVTSAGVTLTQKQQIDLCLIRPVIHENNDILELTYPGMPSVQVPLNIFPDSTSEGVICQGKVCGHKVQGIDCGSEVSEWLSLALRKPDLRLLRQSKSEDFHKEKINKPELSFSSQAQYLMINEASVMWLFDKIMDKDSGCQKDTIVHRFRANIVISGSDPFQETKWKSVKIGNNIFMVDGPCNRCQMVCIDQFTAKKTVEPLRTLAEQFHGKLKFGMYLSRLEKDGGILNIDDQAGVERFQHTADR